MADLTTLRVPDIGDFDEVDVVEVLIEPGQAVSVGDSLITLESDKASLDVPAEAAGTVVEVLVAVGDSVGEGAAICTLEAAAPAEDAPGPGGHDSAPEEEPPPPSTTTAGSGAAASSGGVGPANETADGDAGPGAPGEAAAHPQAAPSLPADASGAFVVEAAPAAPADPLAAPPLASPSVRRLARELGVDLPAVHGSGRKGRITADDVKAHVGRLLRRGAGADGGAGAARGIPPVPEVDFARFGEVEVRPLGRIARLTAAAMTRSWLNVPHVTQHDEADITELEAFRREQLARADEPGLKLSVLPFLIRAVAATLKRFPEFNASLDPSGEHLILKRAIHIGVAVDTPAGLVVPVLRDADGKGLLDLARELADLSARAREGRSALDDFQGGTFTISSLGGIGGTAFTPIVNAPEVAILGVSRHALKPVIRGGEVVPRLMLPLSLSYDHRVIDGAAAARFTTHLSRLLGDIRQLLL